MDNSVQRLSPATPTTVMEAPATMSPDHGTQGKPGADTKSSREILEQYSYLPDDLPTTNPLPEIMAPFQPDRSKLELLPDELLVMIIEALVPTHFALKYTKDYQAHRDILHSLCLVSRRMDIFARPVLYRDLRLYSNARLVRLSGTLLICPRLTSHIKSILFFPHRSNIRKDIATVDLRPLRHLQDSDFAYWTQGKNTAKVKMPENTRDELGYNLLFKILLQTPGLEALYLRLPEHGWPDSHCLRRLKADDQFIDQLESQAQLYKDFCEEFSPIDLPMLKKVGVLGGEPEWGPNVEFIPLFKSLFRSPDLHEVFWAQLDPVHVPTDLWDFPLLIHRFESPRPGQEEYEVMSTSVKAISLRGISIETEDVRSLTKACPSLESLTIGDKSSFTDSSSNQNALDGHRIFQFLGGLENFHTLEFDFAPNCFRSDITTASGPAKLVRLSAMSKLHTLVVPADLFVDFTSDQTPRIQRTTTLLPDSLRCLTLLLDTSCYGRLAEEHGMRIDVTHVVGEFLREEVAPALLVEFPRLEKVDLCYHMEHYRQGKVHTLAARSPRPTQQVDRKPLEWI
ncbi:hypothetical protein F5883DRAFT_686543 [Diaporthe sp. PMI_573]|nr:hypothetical protein F5883DRAFT_686543 [Diaporthaceae sp. PMI_573]